MVKTFVLYVFLLKYKLLFIYFEDSDLKAKFLFKNKVIKSSKNVVSLGGNDVVRDCMGFALGGNLLFGVAFVVNITV